MKVICKIFVGRNIIELESYVNEYLHAYADKIEKVHSKFFLGVSGIYCGLIITLKP